MTTEEYRDTHLGRAFRRSLYASLIMLLVTGRLQSWYSDAPTLLFLWEVPQPHALALGYALAVVGMAFSAALAAGRNFAVCGEAIAQLRDGIAEAHMASVTAAYVAVWSMMASMNTAVGAPSQWVYITLVAGEACVGLVMLGCVAELAVRRRCTRRADDGA